MTGRGIACARLSKWYGEAPALLDLTFAIPRGGRAALFGSNGAGKTTLLRILATLLSPSEGSATIEGLDIQEDDAGVRRQIGFVGHEPGVYGDLTAEENLRFFARLYRVPSAAARVDEMLRASGLQRARRQRARTLSRGMRQRLALGRALLADPPVLLLDEPDTGLDADAREFVENAVRVPGRTTLFATHDRRWGTLLADRLLVLDAGRLEYDGPSAEWVEPRDLPVEEGARE